MLAAIALVALAGWLGPKVAPKFFDSRTKDAEVSKDATAELEKRLAAEREADEKQDAVVSASVQVMGQAAAEAGDAPWAVFVAREAGHIRPLLPAPDYKALYAAEARKRAILEGKLELADKLYRDDAKKSEKLLAENAEFRAKLKRALEERRETDARLAEAAAFSRGKDAVIGALAAGCVVLGLLWLYVKLNGVSLRSLGVAVRGIKDGDDPVSSLDRILSLKQQAKIAGIVSPQK